MERFLKIMLSVILLHQSIVMYAQQEPTGYELKLKSGKYTPKERIAPKRESAERRISGLSKEYVLIQFYSLPSAAELQQLKGMGIEFFNYIPDYAYWASIPATVNRSTLSSFNVRSVEPIQASHKMDPLLTGDELPAYALKQAGKIDLLITYFPDVTNATVISALQAEGAEVLKSIVSFNQIEVRVSIDKMEAIAAIDFVSYVAPVTPAPEGGDIASRTNHRVNGLQSGLPGSLELKGEGVMVGIGDKGYVDPHPDLQNRVTNIQLTSLPDSWSSMDHADHVSGIVAGNGNITEDATGMAPKASLVTDHSTNIIYSAPQYVSNYGMVLTNNSYWWNSSHGMYNSSSEYADAQLLQYPSLLHVFIAGNPGSDYGKVEGFFGSAKNVLTVGSVTTTDNISSFSGRGPCVDGRLKPEIVSVGSSVYSTIKNNAYQYASGTSMACPGVVGSLALLYDQYKKTYGVNPNSGLTKALLCNSADDLGNPGPDYTYGFGRVNVSKAITALNNNQYIQGTVNQGASATHTINVPSGTGQLKVMLYWKDKEATSAAAIALVNNLNLSVSGNGSTYNPWILTPSNPSANAVRGIDNLNNIEQVTIDAPASGSYTISVNGAGITTGTGQEYFIAYEYVQNGLKLVYPTGGESLAPGEGVYLRWDAYANANVSLQYSSDNGQSWTNIASNIAASQKYYYWIVPNLTSAKLLFRVTDGTYTSQSTAEVSVIAVPVNLNATHTSNSITLSWNAVSGASGYQVYLLKPSDNEMQLAGTTSSTSYTISNLTTNDIGWVSVKAVGSNGAKSRRAFAVKPVSTTNLSPSVSIISPSTNATFTAPATIQIEASASDPDGTISLVEFFRDGVKIGEDASSPYTYTWEFVTASNYVLTAKATDNQGLTTESASVTINVVNEGGNCSGVPAYHPYPTVYNSGDRVVYNGTLYESQVNGLYNVTPGTAEHWWKTIAPCGTSQNILPVASVTSPATNTSYFAPATVTITANASDADGNVTKVEFFQNGNKLGEDLTAPYEFIWNNVPAGNYALTVQATDNAGGLSTVSAAVNITITQNAFPVVNITSPANNANFTEPASITISATASDSDGSITLVEFFANGSKLGEDSNAPYSITWNNVAANNYTITAVATDDRGGKGNSAAVTITVLENQVSNQLPVATITAPANNSTYTAPASITITATATDDDGTVTKVEFFQNGNKIGESTTAPFSIIWSNVAEGSYAITAVATDDSSATGNVSPAINITVTEDNNNNSCANIPVYGPYPNIYNMGDRVQHNGVIYESQANSLYNVTPGTAEWWWKTIGPCSGNVKIGLNAMNSTVEVYPNPASSDITVTANTSAEVVYISVINDMGIEVLREKVAVVNGEFEYYTNISSLPAGIYTFMITTTDGMIMQKKLMKE